MNASDRLADSVVGAVCLAAGAYLLGEFLFRVLA